MGRPKQTHCAEGHPLEGSNLVWNSDVTRECRTCKYARNVASELRSKRIVQGQTVMFIAYGCYPASALKPELMKSLTESIGAHMKAYGLKEIAVRSRVLPDPKDTKDSQGGQS